MKLVITTLLIHFLCINSTFSQVADTVIHHDIYRSFDKLDKPFGMRYYFPRVVENKLDSFFTKEIGCSGSKYLFFCRMESNNDTVSIYGYVILKKGKKTRFSQFITSTNRYLIIKKMKMPIYFDTDETFGCLNTVITHPIFYVKFTHNKYTGCHVDESEFWW